MTANPSLRRAGDRAGIWAQAAAYFGSWRGGEALAFDALVRLLTPVLWQVVRAYRLDAATAEDVVQDVWLTLARNPGQVREPEALGGWLLTSARRAAWRAASARRPIPIEDAQRPDTPTATAEDEALDGLANRGLWTAVAALDERCRRLLRVIAFDDRPDYAGLASNLGMPMGSIGPTRRRCLDKLRSGLEGTPHDAQP